MVNVSVGRVPELCKTEELPQCWVSAMPRQSYTTRDDVGERLEGAARTEKKLASSGGTVPLDALIFIRGKQRSLNWDVRVPSRR